MNRFRRDFLVKFSFFLVIFSACHFSQLTWARPASASSRELSKLTPLGELGERVSRLIVSQKDSTLSAVMLAGLQQSRLRILTLRDLKHDWSSEFLAIAVIENRSYSKVHIRPTKTEENYNDELTKRFLVKEDLSDNYTWVVLPKTNNRRNLMTAAHELAHVYVQRFFDDNAVQLYRKYPLIFIGRTGSGRWIMDSDVYAFLTELFARYIEYAYFNLISESVSEGSEEFRDAPYLKKGDSFKQFNRKAIQYLIRDYEIPKNVAMAWGGSPVLVDMIEYAKKVTNFR